MSYLYKPSMSTSPVPTDRLSTGTHSTPAVFVQVFAGPSAVPRPYNWFPRLGLSHRAVACVTSGTAWVQEWGGQRHEAHAGDVVWSAPGVKHWHGATSNEAMTHNAVQDTIDGTIVGWQEHVTDAL
jgi:hypothetical protein